MLSEVFLVLVFGLRLLLEPRQLQVTRRRLDTAQVVTLIVLR